MRPVHSSKVGIILKTLKERYPDVKTQLSHKTPFQLLIATILSARCTDARVNKVSKKLFLKYLDPESLGPASIDDIEKIIFSTGFYRNKARNIKSCALALIERHQGKVPGNIEALVKLPGVGRKTANVVLSAAFGHRTIVVDTHVMRISRRLGLAFEKDPVKIEYELMDIIPEDSWNALSLQMIYFGREICSAKTPLCLKCPLSGVCLLKDRYQARLCPTK